MKYSTISRNVKWNSKFVNKSSNRIPLHKEHIIPNEFIYQKLVDEFNNKDLYNKKDEGVKFIKELLNIHFCGLITNDELTEVLDASDIVIPGVHNIENYLAAISAIFELISVDSVKKVARTFKGVKHRIELIREKNGIKWYNDSIATSPTRTIAGLKCFDGNIILIAGGYDKNFNYIVIDE